MLDQYGPILIFFAIAAMIFPALLRIAKFFRPSFKPTPEKLCLTSAASRRIRRARALYRVLFRGRHPVRRL